MKRILITGVFASGKSTLIQMIKTELEKLGKKVFVFNEVARECPLNLNYEQNLLTTSWLVMRQMENEISKLNKEYDFVIFDRGLPDIVAHTKVIISSKNEDSIFYEKLKELGEASLKSFDYVFLSLMSEKFQIQTDGLRVNDPSYQHRLESIHTDYLRNTRCKFETLLEVNSERLIQVLSII